MANHCAPNAVHAAVQCRNRLITCSLPLDAWPNTTSFTDAPPIMTSSLNGTSHAPQLATSTRDEAPDPVVKQAHIDWIVSQYCKGNAGVLQAICEHFGVEKVEQLHVSHFQQLVQAKKEAAAEENSSSAS